MRATVLVVDDDQKVRDVVAWCLRTAGYRVVTAANGADALRCSARTSVDLFVLDLRMPVLDGAGVLAAIKANPRLRDIPVLLLTGCPQDAPPDVPVLAKPCGREELIDAIEVLLSSVDRSKKGGEKAPRRKVGTWLDTRLPRGHRAVAASRT
jgi:two-component system, chemotaxis family, chemotaxis protein CheY